MQKEKDQILNPVWHVHNGKPPNEKIVMPFSNGKSGHPIIFSNIFFNELTQINE